MYNFMEESIKNSYNETAEEYKKFKEELITMHKYMLETSLMFGKDTQFITELVDNFEGDNDYIKSYLLRSYIIKLIHRMNTITETLSSKSNFPFWIKHKRGKIYKQAMDLRRVLCNIATELLYDYKINKLSEKEYNYYSKFLENIMQIKYDIESLFIESLLFVEKEECIITLYRAEIYFRKIGIKSVIANLNKLNKELK